MALSDDETLAMQAASRHAIAYRNSLAEAPAVPVLRPDGIASRFLKALAEDGMPAHSVIETLVDQAADGIHAHGSGRFFGYVCGGSMPVGIAADMLVSAWGQNSASSWESPSVAAIEQVVCNWCLDLLDLPADSGVGLVTGATVANAQAIMAARHALLARRGWDVEDRGLFGAPEFPVLIGADAHSAPLAGLRYAGLGAGRATRVDTDREGRIRPDALADALNRCEAPPLVILQAGQINTGAFDPFETVVPMIHDRGGWLHVDGAFGLWLHAVPELKHRLAGVDAADSWAVDLHKWLNAPYDAALCIVRNRGPLVASMSARGAYLPAKSHTWEPADSTMELSRRARGVPSYSILRHLGKSGLRAMISRHCTMAGQVAARLASVPGFEVMNEIASNQVAVCCVTDALTSAVLDRVHARGKVYPSHGEWRGRRIIRISITNYATCEADIDLLCDELVSALEAVS